MSVGGFLGWLLGTGDRVTPALHAQRLAICQRCPLLLRSTGQCRVCLCFVQAKAQMANEHCAKGYW